jgi:hypothetical protein
MKTRAILFVAAALAFSAGAASAEETIIHEHTSPGPGVTVGVPGVGVRVGAPGHTERRVIEHDRRSDCQSKTVHREDDTGSTTVHKERCD